jgi:hypothetical protein
MPDSVVRVQLQGRTALHCSCSGCDLGPQLRAQQKSRAKNTARPTLRTAERLNQNSIETPSNQNETLLKFAQTKFNIPQTYSPKIIA